MDTLPEELLTLILFDTDSNTALSCMQVSKLFYKAANNSLLWKQFLDNNKYRTFTNNYKNDYKSNCTLEKFCIKYEVEFSNIFDEKLLNISYINLTTIPTELGQLTNLQGLHLHDNQLTAIPTELGQLTNLQYLSLSDNKLTAIPQELGQLTNLQTLYLSFNQLTTIPAELGQLTNLQKLYLSCNQLTTIPKELGLMTNLQKLDLDYNQLTTIPTELGQLSNLQGLYLSHNNNLVIEPSLLAQLKANIPNLYL